FSFRDGANTQADYQACLLDNLKRYKFRPRAPIHEMMSITDGPGWGPLQLDLPADAEGSHVSSKRDSRRANTSSPMPAVRAYPRTEPCCSRRRASNSTIVSGSACNVSGGSASSMVR